MQTRDEANVEGLDLDAVASVVAEFPIDAAVLYGSVARGEATDRSDVDVGVTFEADLSSEARTDARLGLIERLTAELGTDAVDVVPLDRAPAGLVEDVLSEGIVVYGSPDSISELGVGSTSRCTGEKTVDEFDDVLTDIERVV